MSHPLGHTRSLSIIGVNVWEKKENSDKKKSDIGSDGIVISNDEAQVESLGNSKISIHDHQKKA